jgi:hypothetical protein
MKFTHIILVGASFTKLRLFSHKVSIITNTIFLPLLETLYAGRVKPCSSVASSRTPCFTLSSKKKKAFSECILQEHKKRWKSDGA